MLQQLKTLEPLIGNTPLCALTTDRMNLFAKLEYYNFTGSVKDRPAYNIMLNAIERGEVTAGSTIIESSSGNFAVAMASICAKLHLPFIAVIDPVINKAYELLLNLLCYKVIKVTQQDKTGGYLLTRLETIRDICQDDPSVYWTNQYHNVDNYMSYYSGLGLEIGNTLPSLDYAFIGVSTGGTITGLSRKLKELYPGIKIIAVDVIGSVIFGGAPEKRYISGIGASITSPLLQQAVIDEVVYVSQPDVIKGCNSLLKEHTIFAGGSTGAVYSAIEQYFTDKEPEYRPNVLFLCADRGNGYLQSIYNSEWCQMLHTNINKNKSAENAIHL